MKNPNYQPRWPLYVDSQGNYVRGIPVKTITYGNDGSAMVKFDGGYEDQYISAAFVTAFAPAVGGYVFLSQYGELLYLSKTNFEAKYTKASTSDYVLPAATTSALGGVKQGAAVANSSANDVAGVNTVLNALLASLRSSGVIAS